MIDLDTTQQQRTGTIINNTISVPYKNSKNEDDKYIIDFDYSLPLIKPSFT